MSLISQKDRELAILSLEHYVQKIDNDIFENPNKRENLQLHKTEVLTLINWIKLEHYKNEDKPLAL